MGVGNFQGYSRTIRAAITIETYESPRMRRPKRQCAALNFPSPFPRRRVGPASDLSRASAAGPGSLSFRSREASTHLVTAFVKT